MADQGGSPNEGIVGMFDSRSQDAQAPDWQATGQQAVTAIPNNISGLGGGWSLSESEMERIVGQLDSVRDRLDAALRNSWPMVRIEPPAPEINSQRVADSMNSSGGKYQESLVAQLNYIDQLRQNMQNSLDAARGVESRNAHISQKIDSSFEGPI